MIIYLFYRVYIMEIEDTFCEVFDGCFARLIVTASDKKRLKRAVYGSTSLPSTVFGEAEGGVEGWLSRDRTPDGRIGAIIQIWVSKKGDSRRVLDIELSKRIRQGILVVPTTRIFNALDSDERIDIWNRVGHCGDGYEWEEERFGRKMINIPLMMGEFLIERWLGAGDGFMGGNLWFYCDTIENALQIGDRAVSAIERVEGAITPFDICSAGSKVETNYPEIGPTTNHPYCPTLRGRIPDSKVPEGVGSIPEIVINARRIEEIKDAMRSAIRAVDGMDGLLGISAGNYGGKLGSHRIYLRDL
ncbi:MAG: formylmethanofuran--tetrahydromethanopterin N-formyltransferase [Candidatus Syntrophoarchaeum sp. WYZ-LMO15]|nr:MAG: formylmethanofuran--tetrahydromethanopterin N-formyltransferase [Candidatus Syntrophoarchaeum sp. WYZ-LMO15]